MRPCHAVTKRLCPLAEADAAVSGPDPVLERERKWRGIRAISFFLGGPTGNRGEVRSNWLDTSVLGNPIR